MPPVALTAATAPALIASIAPSAAEPAAAVAREDCCPSSLQAKPVQPARPALRLVASAQPGEIVHGRGGPSTCGCRECTMARHPSAMPRLRVVQ